MGFEDNPADEDPHGECRHEIHRLEAEVERLTAELTAAKVNERRWLWMTEHANDGEDFLTIDLLDQPPLTAAMLTAAVDAALAKATT